MDSAFDDLKVPRDLACDFLGVFARCEYALKAAGLHKKDRADADWGAFAKAIADGFDSSESPDLRAAADYLLTNPPKKQVLRNGALDFADLPPEKNNRKADQVLSMVCRVRNNLFHGGKFGLVSEADRDRLLVQHSLNVLRACVPLHREVAASYARAG